ncbi:MAG: PrsW family glutamic-type intramembrane protease [Tepidisphaerales bacterium]
MSIRWRCSCGKKFTVADEHAGKKGRCPKCGAITTVPMVPSPEPEPEDAYGLTEEIEPAGPAREMVEESPQADTAGHPRTAPASVGAFGVVAGTRRGRGLRDFAYALLLLALLPLVYTTFHDRPSIADRFKQSIQAHPEVVDDLKKIGDDSQLTLDGLLDHFPGHRLDGAMLARDSFGHWGIALLSAAAYFALMLLIFRTAHRYTRSLLLSGLFTGTVGIIMLILFQYAADFTQGMWVRGSGKLTILFYIVKFIGFSYRCAEDPSNGMLASFFGFTFGVGLCEELCKVIPVLRGLCSHPEDMNWRKACLWGLASGVGFGVAEGIMYSGRYYNGILGADIYLVRFASCVALHAIWAATAAIFLYRNRATVLSADSLWGIIGYALMFSAIPMLLHGLYDTLLKKEHPAWALALAMASFAVLAFAIERAKSGEPETDEEGEPQPA